MILALEPEFPPLRVDEAGAVRVGKTRVLFVLVVRAFKAGATPEEIARAYETLELGDTYAAIAYYLGHRTQVEEYLAEYDRHAEEIRCRIEERQGTQAGVRERLLRRLTERRAEEKAHEQLESSQTGPTPKP